MSPTKSLITACLVATVALAGCAKQSDSPVERAVDKTKDALDIRDHEKLKDAGEDAKDAIKDAKDGVKDAVNGKK
jgi:hypothetical protein